MANIVKIRRLVRVAMLKGGESPKKFLEKLLLSIHDTGINNGTILVGTSENGGSATFQITNEFNPDTFSDLVEEAIEWLEQQPDPNNPNLSPRRIKRLRVTFNKAVI